MQFRKFHISMVLCRLSSLFFFLGNETVDCEEREESQNDSSDQEWVLTEREVSVGHYIPIEICIERSCCEGYSHKNIPDGCFFFIVVLCHWYTIYDKYILYMYSCFICKWFFVWYDHSDDSDKIVAIRDKLCKKVGRKWFLVFALRFVCDRFHRGCKREHHVIAQ